MFQIERTRSLTVQMYCFTSVTCLSADTVLRATLTLSRPDCTTSNCPSMSAFVTCSPQRLQMPMVCRRLLRMVGVFALDRSLAMPKLIFRHVVMRNGRLSTSMRLQDSTMDCARSASFGSKSTISGLTWSMDLQVVLPQRAPMFGPKMDSALVMFALVMGQLGSNTTFHNGEKTTRVGASNGGLDMPHQSNLLYFLCSKLIFCYWQWL